jgi:thiosulfate reductase cytochrome b subunit
VVDAPQRHSAKGRLRSGYAAPFQSTSVTASPSTRYGPFCDTLMVIKVYSENVTGKALRKTTIHVMGIEDSTAGPAPTLNRPNSEGPEAYARPARKYAYYRHSLAVRILHWINFIALGALLMSGLQIFNAHPALNWGKSSYTGAPPFFELARGFPSWLTLPGGRWLAMGRRWHLFFAWVLVINGLTYVIYSIASRHLARDLTPTRTDWRSIGRSVIEHLHFRHPTGEAARRYNVLQKLTYLFVIFGLLPFVILMGWALSPRLDTVIPGWVDIVGGRQSARTLHFIAAWALVAFVLVHVFEVLISGVFNNLRSMITGRYTVESEHADRSR